MLKHWPQGVANWPPKFYGILFSALWPIQGHKVQHLLVTWGRLKNCSQVAKFHQKQKHKFIPSYKAIIESFQ
jgi:hypothetical protein